jgi:triosephosphate isomerase
MAKRRKLIIGNWKMNGRLTSGLTLARDLAERADQHRPLAYDLAICPPFTLLWPVAEAIMGTPLLLGAQDCHTQNHGAYTGDVSAGMLTDLGCRYVIIGHSERRQGHGEDHGLIAKKVAAAQLAGLTAVLCVGETQDELMRGETENVIARQLGESLPAVYRPEHLVIAYEPVWAIGSGEQPAVADIEKVHQLIRRLLGGNGETVQVLYGGSVAPRNAGEILASPEIDGALVGSASLNSDGFWVIAQNCA